MMRILEKPITREDLREIAEQSFGEMVKAVVDVDLRLLALDAELHSDLEALLLESGSSQDSLWGINLYPDLEGDDFVEHDSMINLRPSQGNVSRGVDDNDTRQRIVEVVDEWVKR
jgi:hypothetical protein